MLYPVVDGLRLGVILHYNTKSQDWCPAMNTTLRMMVLAILSANVLTAQARPPEPGPAIAAQGQAAARFMAQAGAAGIPDGTAGILSGVRVLRDTKLPLAGDGCPAGQAVVAVEAVPGRQC